jgi:hypothetical protein
MGLDYSTLVYLPNYDMFARPIVVTPNASQPGAPAYAARGIYHSDSVQVVLEDNSFLQDQQTTLDIREVEFNVIPLQGDTITIPNDGNVPPEGDFEVTNAWNNSGGETTLQLKRIMVAQVGPYIINAGR